MQLNTMQRVEGSLIVIGLASHDVHAARLARLGGQPEQVMIIDPLLDPDNPPENSASGHGKTARIPAALAPVDGSAECSVWPALGLHSIYEPTEALQALFPGIRRRQRQQVDTVSIRTLLDRLEALPDPVRVWVDLPGSEATILEVIKETNFVSRIKALELRCGIEPFFEGGRSAADLIAQMAALGFNHVNRDDGDPDFPDLSFEIDARMLRVEELEGALQAAYQERHDAAQAISRQLAATEQELRDAFEIRETLAAENQLLQEQVQGQQSELETLRKERDEQRGLAEENASALVAAREREDALTAQEAAARAQAETLTDESRLLQEQVQGQQEELETVKKERHNMWQDRDKARSELAGAQTAAKAEIEALQGQVQELRQRHSLAREELRRAEGQVELIKDLLLREAVL